MGPLFSVEVQLNILIHQLFEVGAVKFGSFKLKSGITSPIYIDLRVTLSNPQLLILIADAMQEKIRRSKPDLICGVPYTALPFATAISIRHNLPMVLVRKEQKEYGTKKQVEGIFKKDQKCILIEDVITSGQSIFETIVPLMKEELLVEEIVVLVDREQGGKKFIESKQMKVHPVLTITEIVTELVREKRINLETAESVKTFIKNHQLYE